MSTGSTPADWYPDPTNSSMERWWDGTQWTEQTRPAYSQPAPPPAYSQPAPSSVPSYGSGYSQPPQGSMTKPNNYLVWAILTTLFCCLPFGIVSIVSATKVDGAWSSGDFAGAQRHSENAKKWAIIAAILGAVFGIGYAAFVLVVGATSQTTTGF